MDIAIEAADVVIVHRCVVLAEQPQCHLSLCSGCSSLNDLLLMFSLAQLAFRRIRWNFIWALGYNILCIPLAAGVFYPGFKLRLPPAVAGLAMGMSSVCVVLSSLSITLFKPPVDASRDRTSSSIESVSVCRRLGYWCCHGSGTAYKRLPTTTASHTDLEMNMASVQTVDVL